MTSTPPSKLKVLLVSNYPLDRQQSMRRFAEMMSAGLTARGHEVRTLFPSPFLGNMRMLGGTAAKWLGYLDKFILFRPALLDAARQSDIIHICDHSNGMYVPAVKSRPHLITCHDLLAVRAGLGEDTFVDLNPTGKILQHMILNGLRQARTLVCDSRATMSDVNRLVRDHQPDPGLQPDVRLVPLDLNRRLKVLPAQEVDRRLSTIPGLDKATPFLLHVGSSLRRKNRAGILRIFLALKDRFPGQVVFCGQPLPPDLKDIIKATGIDKRVVEIIRAEDDITEALYNRAFALVFPSFSEGFGWPIIEAQACDCPVVCSNTSSCPEAAGEGAFLRDPHDEQGFINDLIKLMDTKERQQLILRGRENLKRFTAGRTVELYEQTYYEVLAKLS